MTFSVGDRVKYVGGNHIAVEGWIGAEGVVVPLEEQHSRHNYLTTVKFDSLPSYDWGTIKTIYTENLALIEEEETEGEDDVYVEDLNPDELLELADVFGDYSQALRQLSSSKRGFERDHGAMMSMQQHLMHTLDRMGVNPDA